MTPETNDEDRLAELLIQWEEHQGRGEDVSAEQLCQDCPHLADELARRIRALRATAWMDRPLDPDTASSSSIPSTHESRTLAGRYRLDALIGEGGFAEVWKAHDLELRRIVAVKMPKASRLGSVERFMAEARRVAKLKHPGVVAVFDVGKDGESCFIVSEFVEGGSLSDCIAKNRPSQEETVRLVAEIAETLAYAHKQGFRHLDVKPSNILIDHFGRALLADFGIARSPEDTTEGGSFGTLAFMSPEQVQGQSVDHRSDIYSLGVVLYELLTGHLPHLATEPVELRRQIVSGSLPSIPTGVSKALERICLKCVARNPTDRYQEAGKLAADLRRSTASTSSSRRLVAGLVGLLVVVTVAGLVIFNLPRQTINQPDDPGGGGGQDKLAPGTVEAALALGKLHSNKKEWDQAEAAFTEAIKLDPNCAEAYHQRAGCLFNVGKIEESLPDFDKAAQFDPKNAEICKNRAFAYLKLVRFDDALADLKHALELDPKHPDQYRKAMGLVYGVRAYERTKEKKDAEAIADFTEAINFDPTNAEFFDKRGSLYFNIKEFDKALKDFTEAIRLDSKPEYFLHRGYAHEALGMNDEAAEDYRKGKQTPAPK